MGACLPACIPSDIAKLPLLKLRLNPAMLNGLAHVRITKRNSEIAVTKYRLSPGTQPPAGGSPSLRMPAQEQE